MSDDVVHVGELVSCDEPVVEPRTVLPGEPRCDVETTGSRQMGRIRLTLRTRCELPPEHACDHRVTMPDGETFRW
ncbi:hypothetical protein SEA_HANS_19 [Gordonia phage Hans]|uniref:Uncharacterized protein n=1 Tax=Gordonia Phage Phauci TaxID=2951392 RepID=A0A9E7T0X4_9CAUD|nr:hypothetical protein SEA_HANS_19 [Gordonia phage Hans]UTN93097.1 hypothetical protein SEA_PHAUCI_10 [Gordonia Phage Phauci]